MLAFFSPLVYAWHFAFGFCARTFALTFCVCAFAPLAKRLHNPESKQILNKAQIIQHLRADVGGFSRISSKKFASAKYANTKANAKIYAIMRAFKFKAHEFWHKL
ncbi:hypothetical protein BKN38_05975 [Helicobacter sp. CLO-3]|nr:hypothetical protein BKN38_05975 [Helicobacter sp. CLO-3]